MHSVKCISEKPAFFICIDPNCQSINPLLCAEENDCSCRRNFHHHEISMQIQLKNLISQIQNLQQPLKPLKQKINKSFKRQQQNYLQFLKEQQQKVEQILIQQHCNLIHYDALTLKKIRNRDFSELTAKNIHKLKTQLENNFYDLNLEASQHEVSNYLSTLQSELSEFNESLIKKSSYILPPIFESSFVNPSLISYKLTNQPEVNLQLVIKNNRRLKQIHLDDYIIPRIVQTFPKLNSIKINTLTLNNNNLNDQSISKILKCNFLNLTQFQAAKNQITDNGAIQIANKPNWNNLKYLNLYCNKIKSKGASQLIKKYNQKFERFDLGYNLINDEFSIILKHYDWNELQQIYIDGNDMTIGVLSELNNFFLTRPKINIQKINIIPQI